MTTHGLGIAAARMIDEDLEDLNEFEEHQFSNRGYGSPDNNHSYLNNNVQLQHHVNALKVATSPYHNSNPMLVFSSSDNSIRAAQFNEGNNNNLKRF
jgi:hypothetical protein